METDKKLHQVDFRKQTGALCDVPHVLTWAGSVPRPVLAQRRRCASTRDLEPQILKERLQARVAARKPEFSRPRMVISLLGPDLRVGTVAAA